jgi:hypothetical protein
VLAAGDPDVTQQRVVTEQYGYEAERASARDERGGEGIKRGSRGCGDGVSARFDGGGG